MYFSPPPKKKKLVHLNDEYQFVQKNNIKKWEKLPFCFVLIKHIKTKLKWKLKIEVIEGSLPGRKQAVEQGHDIGYPWEMLYGFAYNDPIESKSIFIQMKNKNNSSAQYKIKFTTKQKK